LPGGPPPFRRRPPLAAGSTARSARLAQRSHRPNNLADLAAIRAPALSCGSFSDQRLHSNGCFDAFTRIGSAQKYLFTLGRQLEK
jgi:predicted acyl esterase